MRFALTLPTPDRVAVIEHNGICWPFLTVEHAREIAASAGSPGFWRLKALKKVEAEA